MAANAGAGGPPGGSPGGPPGGPPRAPSARKTVSRFEMLSNKDLSDEAKRDARRLYPPAENAIEEEGAEMAADREEALMEQNVRYGAIDEATIDKYIAKIHAEEDPVKKNIMEKKALMMKKKAAEGKLAGGRSRRNRRNRRRRPKKTLKRRRRNRQTRTRK